MAEINRVKSNKNIDVENITKELKFDLIKYVNTNGIPKNLCETFKAKNGLRDVTTYKKYLGKSLSDWLINSGIYISEEEKYLIEHRGGRFSYSKDEAITIIYQMEETLNRPLMYDDFRHPKEGFIGLTTVKKYWTTVNKMKLELGLEIIQDSMVARSVGIEKIKEMIISTCQEINKLENRRVLLEQDFDNKEDCLSAQTLRLKLKQNTNMDLREYLLSIGFDLIKSGHGLQHIFEDGEKTMSKFEYNFSNILKSQGYTYNVSYFRSVKYKTFIPCYKQNKDCDYLILIGDRKVYIEIAGILNNYEKYYINDETIKQSKSKEKYRLSLKNKENLFKNEGLEYYILFPEDINEDVFNKITSGLYSGSYFMRNKNKYIKRIKNKKVS